MATIVNRITGSDGDKVLSLSFEQIARQMDIGQNWTRLRIGMRCEFSSSASTILNPVLAFGLTSGTASLFGDATTNNFLGTFLDPAEKFAYVSSSADLVGYFTSTDGFNVADSFYLGSRIGSASTVYANNFSYFGGIASPSPSLGQYQKFRTYYFIEFLKSNTDPGFWTVIYIGPFAQGTAFSGDESFNSFYANLTQDTASLDFASYRQFSVVVPMSESLWGHLDTINVYWNKTSPPLEISDIAAYRFR